MAPRALGSLLALAAALFAGSAAAQDVRSLPAYATPSSDARLGIGTLAPYWSSGSSRPFLAAVIETVGLSLRAEMDLGFGKPHYAWAGAELSSSLSLRGTTTYLGARGALPWGSLRAGARYFAAAQQRLLVPSGQIERAELDVDEGPRTRYVSLEASADADIPLPFGGLVALGSVHRLFGVERGYLVFEDALRVVAEPPWLARGRLTYLVGFGTPATLRLGVLAEVIGDPQRETLWVRTGPAVAVSLTHHLDAVGVAAISVFSPDEIGLAGSDLGQIGLRYRWATGDLWPEFP